MGSPSRYSSKQHGSSWLNWPNMITLKGPHLSNHGSLERYEKVPKIKLRCFFLWRLGVVVLKFFSFLSILFGWFVGKHGEEFVSWKVFETLKVGIQKTFCGRAEGLLNLSSVSELLLHSVVLLGQWRSQEWLVIALCLLCLLYLLFSLPKKQSFDCSSLENG